MRRSTLLVFAVAGMTLLTLGGCSLWGSKPVDWSRQLKTDPDYFPIGVWMQPPTKAGQYQAMGINLYVNLWKGPTNEQLAELADADMPVFCEMEYDARQNIDNSIIVGWLHIDEPDNAQKVDADDGQTRYAPPRSPEQVIAHYTDLKKIDPTRPVMLNLGQGVAWDDWIGRGVRTSHPEDYARYLKGCDMASFDIYPVVHSHHDIAGNLWYVPLGVSRLIDWSQGQKMVWAAIEASRIGNVNVKPTPEQIRAEVWMAIIHGARGIVYFAHQFAPQFRSSAILDDPTMYAGVKAINKEVHSLARVINAPLAATPVAISSSNSEVPVAAMTRLVSKRTYVFAVAMRDGRTTATFTVPGAKDRTKVKVINEDRVLPVENGQFSDIFTGYQVHLYKID